MKISTTGKSVQTHGHREYDGIHHKEDAEREKKTNEYGGHKYDICKNGG